MELKKEFGLLYSTVVLTSLINGGGIYISPQIVLSLVSSPGLTILSWIFGGVYSLINALCFSELGVKYPKSGAFYVYLMEFYGSYMGFVYVWQNIFLVRCGNNYIKCTIISSYLLKVFFQSCPIPTIATKCVASWITSSFIHANKI